METISLKLEDSFLKDISAIMKRYRYSTRTEFIREAMRDKIKQLEKEESLLKLEELYGASNKKTTGKKEAKAKEIAFQNFLKRRLD